MLRGILNWRVQRGPGVNINTSKGYKFSFLHTGTFFFHPPFFSLFFSSFFLFFSSLFANDIVGAHPDFWVCPHNHGLSVNNADFKKAYETYAAPFLKAARDANLLTAEQIVAISAYDSAAFTRTYP